MACPQETVTQFVHIFCLQIWFDWCNRHRVFKSAHDCLYNIPKGNFQRKAIRNVNSMSTMPYKLKCVELKFIKCSIKMVNKTEFCWIYSEFLYFTKWINHTYIGIWHEFCLVNWISANFGYEMFCFISQCLIYR